MPCFCSLRRNSNSKMAATHSNLLTVDVNRNQNKIQSEFLLLNNVYDEFVVRSQRTGSVGSVIEHSRENSVYIGRK